MHGDAGNPYAVDLTSPASANNLLRYSLDPTVANIFPSMPIPMALPWVLDLLILGRTQLMMPMIRWWLRVRADEASPATSITFEKNAETPEPMCGIAPCFTTPWNLAMRMALQGYGRCSLPDD